MDPNIIAALRQRMMGGQGQDPQAPQQQPQQQPPQGGPMGGENPFMKFVQQRQAQQASQGAPQGQQGVPAPGMDANGKPIPDQMAYGETGDRTKSLTSAISSLQQFIAQSTEVDDIRTARSIILLLGQLVQRDQETMAQKLPEQEQ